MGVKRWLFWAFSSHGRAPASHAGGSGIDTRNVHFRHLIADLYPCSPLPDTSFRFGVWSEPVPVSYSHTILFMTPITPNLTNSYCTISESKVVLTPMFMNMEEPLKML